MRHRLVKQTFASGYVQWNVEKKFLLWWYFVYGSFEEKKARKVLESLQAGKPYLTEEVQPDTPEETNDVPW